MTGAELDGPVLAAGVTIAAVAMLLTHPVAVLACLVLALVYAWKVGVRERTAWVHRAALGLGVAVLVFNALFAWQGATVLWQAPFRVTWLGRPRLTLEAITWGGLAGVQLATTVIALGAATLTVPPERLHRSLSRIGAPAPLAQAASLALRLVPETTRDADAMRQALATRGVSTDGLSGTSQVLVPLTARSLDRALVSEASLRMRGYEPATSSDGGGLGRAAWLGIAGLALAGLVAFLGPGRPDYYPHVTVALDPSALLAVGLALLVPALLVREVVASSR